MKKLFVLFVALVAMHGAALASDDKPITVAELPSAAQQFIKTYFAADQVSMATVDPEWINKTYDVYFASGSKVEFDKAGQWKEVKCPASQVPAKIVPAAIQKLVHAQHAGAKIIKIDRDTYDYEVELSNGTELKFNKQGALIGYDD